jgi:hypothetical protein
MNGSDCGKEGGNKIMKWDSNKRASMGFTIKDVNGAW